MGERTHELIAAFGGVGVLLDALPDGIALLDRQATVVLANRRLLGLLGVERDALVGRALADQLSSGAPVGPGSPGERGALALATLFGPGGEGGWLDQSHARSDGEALELRVTASPLRDPAGAELGCVVVVTDLTEPRRAQAERAELERKLAQAQKMEAIGRMAGGIAHDFNNMLSVIMTGASALRVDLPATASAQIEVDEIARAAERSAELTRQLLAFSRRQHVQLEALDLNGAILGVEPMLRRLLREDIALLLELRSELPPIHADRSLIERVLLNLVVNAQDAMPQGGTIAIQTRGLRLIEPSGASPDGSLFSQVLLRVRDTGFGMDATTRQRIFEPFFTTKEPGNGTGLGLATVYGVVRQCGGTIEVTSAPGKGTRFDLRFPPSAQRATSEARPASPAPGPGAGARILLVEDEPTVRRAARRVLERDGYQVIAAVGGAEALAAFERDAALDLVLTDVVMPGMSGRELVEALHARAPGLPVLYTSGYTEDEILLRGIRAEVVDFLPKPFSAEQLLGKVAEVLARHRAARAHPAGG